MFGFPPRPNVLCPNCRSLERHRLLKLLLDRQPDYWKQKDILHFAPEDTLRGLLERAARRYVAGDLNPGEGEIELNIEKLNFPDKSFDLVVCSHVLEHVDDKLALAEMFRVLRAGGKLLLLFPIVEGWENTYENPDFTSPELRQRYFGQTDHVRRFGKDARDRIKGAGFGLSEFTAMEPDAGRYGLSHGSKVFVATRPA